MKALILILGMVLGTAVSAAPLGQAAQAPSKIIEISLKDALGNELGKATLKESDSKAVHLSLRVGKLKPGTHGVHFHEKGVCEGPDFKSAGAHFSPLPREHGSKNPKGPHAGDLPNLEIGSDGSGLAEWNLPRVTLRTGPGSLLREGGTALVIHAGADDLKSNPSGNSGDRIACGVIRP